jgi:hypothetical protein
MEGDIAVVPAEDKYPGRHVSTHHAVTRHEHDGDSPPSNASMRRDSLKGAR